MFTLAAQALHAQQRDSAAFVVQLGQDTLAVERYVRTSRQLIADALLRTPRTRALHLAVNFRSNGSVTNYELLNSPVAGVPNTGPAVRTVVTFIGDSARVQVTTGTTTASPRMIATQGGLLPMVQPFYSPYEAVLARARARFPNAQTVRMLDGTRIVPFVVRWAGNQIVTLSNAGTGTLRGRMTRAGHLLSLTGESTTFKVSVTRTSWIDLAAYARRFARADIQGKSLGVLSPRDTLHALIGTTRLLVDYSRPSKRGRIVFGGLVPWHEVWRTGANAATQIQFDAPISIHGVAIAAGKYTLWSIPDPRRWQLIINKQTGQWGTEYDARQDLVRIPVKVETLSVPVETFTVGVRDRSAAAAMMTLSWDRTRVVVPIVVQGARATTAR